jgi:hypothetical protein
MPVFDKRRRESERRKERWKFGALILSGLALLFGGSWLARRAYYSVYVQPYRLAPPAPRFRAARPVFPYSVVPGGVYDPKELMETIRVDPVARVHYSDIRIENLVPVRIQSPMEAYVSYRIGNNVYWTSKKLSIPRGELVLTDGKNMIRARCGNRVVTQFATSGVKSSSQSEKTLETVFETPIPSLVKLPPFLQPVLPPGAMTPDMWEAPRNELASTPEPTTLVLYSSGMSLILFSAAWRRRRSGGDAKRVRAVAGTMTKGFQEEL